MINGPQGQWGRCSILANGITTEFYNGSIDPSLMRLSRGRGRQHTKDPDILKFRRLNTQRQGSRVSEFPGTHVRVNNASATVSDDARARSRTQQPGG
ncbi:hypothetical protein ALC60_14134 [Trachymyrmex zeteki]|uniref:Uncharacterized protein n=1 Tax=Mycetomoellerius zeteki TaxID=64791 RepID=A0A151WG72_9HYME|nr:hypothetical protein ALC60_14134 [Trachymyrmex zeteki]